jgi:hypothetical protein
MIDIPIVTISLASVDVFTSATVTEDMKPEEIVHPANHKHNPNNKAPATKKKN